MQQPIHIRKHKHSRAEQITRLKLHSKQDFKLAIRSYARVSKTATYSGFIVFIVMSYFLHAALLSTSADSSAHLLVLVVNIALAFFSYKLIHEFHPLRIIGAKYWQSCDQHKQQIKKLESL